MDRFKRSLRVSLYCLVVVSSLFLTVLFAGGMNFVAPTKIEQFHFDDEATVDDGAVTLFLYPGKPRIASGIGLVYIIFFGMALFVGLFMLPWSIYRVVVCYPELSAVERFASKHPMLCIASIPLVPLFLHLCANLHWQFYCRVGVLAPHNCFLVFDARSLLVGLAGFIGLCIVAFALALCAFLCYQGYRLALFCCCFERVPTKGTATLV